MPKWNVTTSYIQASKQACGLIMSWVAHQNEHESSMMGLQALKWPFVAVTTTTITKLFERGGEFCLQQTWHDKTKGAPTSFDEALHHHKEIKFTSPTRRRRNTITITPTTIKLANVQTKPKNPISSLVPFLICLSNNANWEESKNFQPKNHFLTLKNQTSLPWVLKATWVVLGILGFKWSGAKVVVNFQPKPPQHPKSSIS